MSESYKEDLWIEKYRPKTIDQCIIPEQLKKTLNNFIEQDNLPNLILSGTAGIGKAQPLNSVVLDKDGKWIKVGDLKVGDKIIVGDGTTAKISKLFDQGVRDVYTIELDDNTSFKVADNHLNSVIINGERKDVETTELINILDKNTVINNVIINSNSNINVMQVNVVEVCKLIKEYDKFVVGGHSFSCCVPALKLMLVEALNTVNASCLKDRITMITNLIDDQVDFIKKDRVIVSIVCQDEDIKQSIANIARSVAMIATIDDKGIEIIVDKKHPLIKFADRRYFKPVKYNKEKWVEKIKEYNTTTTFGRRIVNITKDDDKQKCRCLYVDHPTHQYITNNYTLTHNTTIARALCNQLGYDTLFINASMDNGIDTLRNKVTRYASSVSLNGKKKAVIFDEGDHLNPQSIQPALRGFIEQFTNVRFIFTCNYLSKIIAPLQSRTALINFECDNEERKKLFIEALKRLCFILKNEHVEFDLKLVAMILKNYYPDLRRTLNELQQLSLHGPIVGQIEIGATNHVFEPLIKALKEKDFSAMRKWVGENEQIDSQSLFKYMYDHSDELLINTSIPQLILTSAEYQYKSAFVADQQINTCAYLTELMANCAFK